MNHVKQPGEKLAEMWDKQSDPEFMTPTPATSPDDLVNAALPKGKWCDCGLPHETGGPCWECRAAATDPATVAAIIERAGE
jgi:hypothetical protein